jgi:hypothetical protein
VSAGYAAVAAALAEIADRLDSLGDRTDLNVAPRIRMSIMPGARGAADPDNARIVDTVASALLDADHAPADRRPFGEGEETYVVHGVLGGVHVAIQAMVPDPDCPACAREGLDPDRAVTR